MSAVFIIIGKGGHARCIAGVLKYFHQDSVMLDSDEQIPDSGKIIIGVGNKPSMDNSGLSVRKALYEQFAPRVTGFSFPGVMAGAGRVIDDTAQIFPASVINPNVSIGPNTIINSGAIVEHDCEVGSHCHIAPGAVLCGGVRVGMLTHVGAGAVVLQGVSIGSNSVIGAGSVVTDYVPCNGLWIGNKLIKTNEPKFDLNQVNQADMFHVQV